MTRFVAGLILVLLVGWSAPVLAGPTYLIILGGGTAPAEAEQQREVLSGPLFKNRLRLLPGYVQIEESAKVAGLTPGFFVATLGTCADRDKALGVVHELKRLILQAGAVQKPYLRPINDGRPDSCPTLVEPPQCPAVAECATLCAAGDASACDQQAHLIGGLRTPKAQELVEKACTLGKASSCAWLSNVLKDPALQFRYRERACKLGSLRDCVLLANFYLDGGAVEKDPPRGIALLENACKKGDSDGCSSLGELYFDSTDPALKKRGRRILRDLCNGGENSDACRKLGDLKGACEAGDVNACCERNPRSRVCDV